MGFPVTYLLATAILFDIPAKQCVSLLLSPWFYLISLAGMIMGYGLWEMRRWVWYVFTGLQFAMLYTNALLVADYGQSHHKVVSYIVSVFLTLALFFRVRREVKVPYFHPTIRWWESDSLYRLSIPVTLKRKDNETEMNGEVLDLSVGGCFVKVRQDFKADEEVQLKLTSFGVTTDCAGHVVWRTRSGVTHPKGIGVKFTAIARPQRRPLRAMVQRVRKINHLYRSSRYLLSHEEFALRMNELKSAKVRLSNHDALNAKDSELPEST